MNDSDLVRGLRERDPAAVRHLSECWLPSVWRFVYVRVNRDQHLAEDIVSESVLALITAAGDEEKEITNPGAWLRSVAANKVNDHFRAAARVQHLLAQANPNHGTDTDGDPSGQQERKEQRAAIRSVLESLDETPRMALEWKYIDRLSVREIAARLDLTEKAAESVLFRARREFRSRMERTTDEVPAAQDGGAAESAPAMRLTAERQKSTKSTLDDEPVEDEPQPADKQLAGRRDKTTQAGKKAGQRETKRVSKAVELPTDAEHPVPVVDSE